MSVVSRTVGAVGLALGPFLVLLLLARLSWFEAVGNDGWDEMGWVLYLLGMLAIGRLVRTGCGSISRALFIR